MINISYVVKIDGEVQIKQFQVIRGVPDGLTTEMLLNRDEIVHDIITNRLSDNEKIYFRNATDETLSMEHMGMGMSPLEATPSMSSAPSAKKACPLASQRVMLAYWVACAL